MNRKLLSELKQAFRDLYGAFSVEELTTNPDLIAAITRLENMFLRIA